MSNLTWNQLKPVDFSNGQDEIYFPNSDDYLNYYEKHSQNYITSWEDDFWLEYYDDLLIDIFNDENEENHIKENAMILKQIEILDYDIIDKDSCRLYTIKYNNKIYNNVKINNIRVSYKVKFYEHISNHIKKTGKILFCSSYWRYLNPLSNMYHFGYLLFDNGLLNSDNCFDFKKYGLHAKYSYRYKNENNTIRLVEYLAIEEAKGDLCAGPSPLQMKQIIHNCIKLE